MFHPKDSTDCIFKIHVLLCDHYNEYIYRKQETTNGICISLEIFTNFNMPFSINRDRESLSLSFLK